MPAPLTRRARLIFGATLLLGVGCATPAAPPTRLRSPVTETPLPLFPRTIVVDAGHGGRDPGTSHNGLQEKQLTLDIARRLRTELSERGMTTVMTRDRDEFIALSRRPDVANDLSADLFVSVHINANRNRRVSGVEVYYPRESVITGSVPFPPGIESVEVAIPTMTIKQILWDLVLTRSRRRSSHMAAFICRSLRDQLGVPCRGVRGARFVVLREARMPAVLVEVGYVTNRPEASRLATTSYRQAIAQAIASGVMNFLKEQEPPTT